MYISSVYKIFVLQYIRRLGRIRFVDVCLHCLHVAVNTAKGLNKYGRVIVTLCRLAFGAEREREREREMALPSLGMLL